MIFPILIKELNADNEYFAKDSLYLSGFMKSLASNIEQIPSNHSYGYAFQDRCPIFLASISRNFTPSMKYPG